jgi:hypothetical protein
MHGIAKSQIIRLCRQEKFEGAEKVGGIWIIPRETAEKFTPSGKGGGMVKAWEPRRRIKDARKTSQQNELQQAIEAAKRK